MGLRIILGVTLASLLVVLASAAYGGGPPQLARGETSQREPMKFAFGGDGRPNAYDTHLQMTCSRDVLHRVVHWYDGDDVDPFAGQGDDLRRDERQQATAADGTVYETRFSLTAHVRDGAINGRMQLLEQWTRGGELTGRCRSGLVTFTVPLQ